MATGYPSVKKTKLNPPILYKSDSKQIMKLNVKAKTIKLLDESIRNVNLHYLGLGNDFLPLIPEV